MVHRCIKCGEALTQHNSRQSQLKNGCYICKRCDNDRKNMWNHNNRERCNATSTRSRRKHGQNPMTFDKNGSQYLGIVVAEQVLSRIFHNVERMPYANKGFDFICNRGKKIDVKSACIRKIGGWEFTINKNIIADYFLCLAFDNRKDLNPLHLWLVPGCSISHLSSTSISVSTLYKWTEYKLSDRLGAVIDCCDSMKDLHHIDELCDVEGIGKTTAENILEIVESEYKS